MTEAPLDEEESPLEDGDAPSVRKRKKSTPTLSRALIQKSWPHELMKNLRDRVIFLVLVTDGLAYPDILKSDEAKLELTLEAARQILEQEAYQEFEERMTFYGDDLDAEKRSVISDIILFFQAKCLNFHTKQPAGDLYGQSSFQECCH